MAGHLRDLRRRLALRVCVAVAIPLVVPAIVTGALWALPGDPAVLICPPEVCEGTSTLARDWNLDRGPVAFYVDWLWGALGGDLGRSWSLLQGVPVRDLLWSSWAITAALVGLALIPTLAAGAATLAGRVPRALRAGLEAVGLLPVVVGGLLAAAWVELTLGAGAYHGGAGLLRLVLGAVVLVFTDRFLASTVGGLRARLRGELDRRYVRMAVLRGERVLDNVVVNLLPGLVAQLRGRVLQLLSAAVVVEVVLGVPGLGQLLFDGTLAQDFGVVLAASWAYSVVGAALLLLHAAADVAQAAWVRWTPPALRGAA